MDADVTSPSYGVAALQQENAIDNLTERFRLETQSVSEEHVLRSSSFSVISRWYKLRSQFKDMTGKIQQWCQDDTQAIPDLGFLAPSAFGFKTATIPCEKCASTICDALAVLKETCESLVISKQELTHAEEQYAVAMKKRTDAENRIVPNDPHAEKDRTLELLHMVLAAKANLASMCANLVSSYANGVFDCANAIYLAHRAVRGILLALGAAGNGTSLITPRDLDLAKSHDSLSNASVDLEVRSSLSQFSTVYYLSEMELDKLDFLRTLDADHQARLCPLYNILKLILGRAALLESKDKNYNNRIDATVKAINEWKIADQSTTNFSAPGCQGQERGGMKPILYAIMSQMVHVLGLEQHITREQDTAKVENCSVRGVDFVVTQVDERTILPATLGIPIEVRSTFCNNADVAQLLLEMQDQVIGHLAKRAMFSFEFGGIGEDCQVFGLELTMGSVAVIVLTLSGVGTHDVKITTQRTKPVPLFDAATRGHLFGETAKDVKASFDGVEEQEGMPAGFCLLARMLMAVQPEVGISLTKPTCCKCLSMRVANSESIRVGPHLGSGAYAHVFALDLNGTKDAFVKVPKSHQMMTSLEREAEVLGALPVCEGIPQLQDTNQPIKILDVQFRCEFLAMPCLPLRGLIGAPASQHPWNGEDWKSIFLGVYAILKVAHDHGWAHLDVRPSNIITNGMSDSDRGPVKVMLIDWGCAHRTDSKLMKFEGCPPYAHDDLFGLTKKGWTPSQDHDLASLVYTVASAFHGGVPNDVRECHGQRCFEACIQGMEVISRDEEGAPKSHWLKGDQQVSRKSPRPSGLDEEEPKPSMKSPVRKQLCSNRASESCGDHNY